MPPPAGRPTAAVPRQIRQARTVLALAVVALVGVAIAAIVIISSNRGDGGVPLRTSPNTISPDAGAGSQCPAGAFNGHCIIPATTAGR